MKTTKGTAPLFLLLGVFAIFLAVGGVWYFNSKQPAQSVGQNQVVPPSIPAGWKTYTGDSISFKYPADWKVTKDYYQTPAEEAQGMPASVVDLSVTPNNQQSPYDAIVFGGRQFDCNPDGVGFPRCLTIYEPVHTQSKNAAVLSVFDAMVKTITYTSPQDFTIQSPFHNNEWTAGKSYVVQWTTTTTVPNVTLTLLDARKYQGDPVWQAANVPNPGSYMMHLPIGKSSNLSQSPYTLFGPYILSISARGGTVKIPSGGTGVRYYTGVSDPFWINSQGEPNFTGVPRG